jgi:hypothetical protein
VHYLNRFAFQFENLINLLDNGFENLVTANIRRALARRVERELLATLYEYDESHNEAGNLNNGNGAANSRDRQNSNHG